jgi:predicted transcriptional regulator
MDVHHNTESLRLNKDLMQKIREIAKSKRQTISGYIEINLLKTVDRDWRKLKEKEDGFQQSKN